MGVNTWLIASARFTERWLIDGFEMDFRKVVEAYT